MQSLRSILLKQVASRDIHINVRGGYRVAKFLSRGLDSFPIQINDYPPLYVNLSDLDPHALLLLQSMPLNEVPHERTLTQVLRQLVRKTDTVFDIGANLGLHSLTLSKLAANVVAFEPNRSLLANLRKTLSNRPNATLHDVCLGETDGTTQFHISEWDHMLGSRANWTGQPSQTVDLPMRSIDSLIEEGAVKTPQGLKVDVEGAELLVFRGAEKLFSGPQAPRFIVFEELNPASQKLGLPDGAAADYLRSKGYSLYLIEDTGLSRLQDTRPTAANLLALKGVDLE